MADPQSKNPLVWRIVMIAVAALGAYLILDACTRQSAEALAALFGA
ncbi:hypothetical protein ONR57_21030 [Hoyosella sp. YIM 151337]|nr:hypothetical protein [Hoyosella sp. YIM 151337]MCW4355792.1 hypothetical protein [Hoyosella sp. YIM 151337]